MAPLALRSVAGEVGGHVSVHILSHPIPVARTRLKPMRNAHSVRSSIALRVGADPVGSLEVGEHQDVEQLGAGNGTESVQALPEAALKLVGTHTRAH
jgi:hypothetical protein